MAQPDMTHPIREAAEAKARELADYARDYKFWKDDTDFVFTTTQDLVEVTITNALLAARVEQLKLARKAAKREA